MDDRDSSPASGIVSFGPFRLIAAKRLLTKANGPIPLGGRALEAAERVVSEAPQAHVLATSREALRAEGEHSPPTVRARLSARICPSDRSGKRSAIQPPSCSWSGEGKWL
jgi:hypothetical protein